LAAAAAALLCGPAHGLAQTPSPAGDSDYTRALAQFHARDFKGSLSTVNTYLATHPSDAHALALRGDDEAELGNTRSALRDYDSAIGISPDFQYAYVTRCETRLYTDNVAGALADCNAAVRLGPQDGLAHEDRGDVYFQQNAYDAAVRDYSRAIALGRSGAYIFAARCDAERLAGNRSAAAADCAKALTIEPLNRRTLWANGRLATTGGRYAAAIGFLNTYIAQKPKQSDTGYYYRGFVYNRVGNYRSALADLRTYVSRAPKDPDGYRERAVARFGTADRSGSIADFTVAIRGYRQAGDISQANRARAMLAAVRAGRAPKL
jgi:tetratricopeptide (TPR) repeat protein